MVEEEMGRVSDSDGVLAVVDDSIWVIYLLL